MKGFRQSIHSAAALCCMLWAGAVLAQSPGGFLDELKRKIPSDVQDAARKAVNRTPADATPANGPAPPTPSQQSGATSTSTNQSAASSSPSCVLTEAVTKNRVKIRSNCSHPVAVMLRINGSASVCGFLNVDSSGRDVYPPSIAGYCSVTANSMKNGPCVCDPGASLTSGAPTQVAEKTAPSTSPTTSKVAAGAPSASCLSFETKNGKNVVWNRCGSTLFQITTSTVEACSKGKFPHGFLAVDSTMAICSAFPEKGSCVCAAGTTLWKHN